MIPPGGTNEIFNYQLSIFKQNQERKFLIIETAETLVFVGLDFFLVLFNMDIFRTLKTLTERREQCGNSGG